MTKKELLEENFVLKNRLAAMRDELNEILADEMAFEDDSDGE